MTQPSDAEAQFGALVRDRRTLLQWTQEQLRRRLLDGYGIELSKTAMARLEQGKRPIRLNEVAALAQLLEIDLQVYGKPTRSEAQMLDAALADVTERLAAVDREIAVASARAEQAHESYQEARHRIYELQHQRGLLNVEMINLLDSLQGAADARYRAELKAGDDTADEDPELRIPHPKRIGSETGARPDGEPDEVEQQKWNRYPEWGHDGER